MSDEQIKEHEEQAQIIIDATVKRLREMGFGLVADGTVHGNGVWIGELRARRVPKDDNEKA